jgi:hypothetical protein
VLDPADNAVADAAANLEANGYDRVTLVSPAATLPPKKPLKGRSAA